MDSEKSIFISDLKNHIDKKVCLKGWVYNLRSSGKVRFIILRDGTGFIQCVLTYDDLKKKLFDAFDALSQESSIQVFGFVKKWKDSFEIQVEDFQVISISQNYPISKKEHGIDFLMQKRHLWIRSKRPYAVLRIRSFVIQAIHKFFSSKNFLQMDPPVFTPSACEGTSTLFEVNSDFMDSLYLSQSGQMYLEALSAGFNQVYCLNPAFRAEKSSTRRHLMEFWMCEAEMAFYNLNQNMDLIEDFVVFIIQYILEYAQSELKLLDRNVSDLEKVQKPFPRLHYQEACEKLVKHNPGFKAGSDFGGSDETFLSSLYPKPVFIYNYPSSVKAFYMKQNANSESLSCDLLAPSGYGELVGGGERETNLDTLLESIKLHKLNQEDFEWYLDLRRYGSFAHSGFGLGLERLICWIGGLDHIREAVPFPRVYGRKFFEKP